MKLALVLADSNQHHQPYVDQTFTGIRNEIGTNIDNYNTIFQPFAFNKLWLSNSCNDNIGITQVILSLSNGVLNEQQ